MSNGVNRDGSCGSNAQLVCGFREVVLCNRPPQCSPDGFRAKGRIVLGEAQDPRVRASQGVYCSGFINKTNKQTKDKAQAPQKRRVPEKIPGQLEASFLIFCTLGLIKQSNTRLDEDGQSLVGDGTF